MTGKSSCHHEGLLLFYIDNYKVRAGGDMYDREELCRKITELYPDIGECGINLDAKFDMKKKVWIIDLIKDTHELQHHLEIPDADDCMNGKQCVALGLEIAQLRKNIEGSQF